MTARKGLKIFKGDHANIFYSEHPNLNNTCIIFPPADERGIIDILDLFELVKNQYKKVQIIRVPKSKAEFWAMILRGKAKKEDVLDYTYPVYTVSTSSIIEMKGSKFYNFKKTLNKIKDDELEIEPIDFTKDKQKLSKLLLKWVKDVSFNPDVNIAEPALYVSENLGTTLSLNGFIIYQAGKACGFAIWENPQTKNQTACATIHCARHIQGLSEFIHFKISEILLTQGIQKLCIGGSETHGLDFFKRKMQPCEQDSLMTINLK
ncbi:MAG: phosphatidylglycerol lysyltransferase domain-containing protein [Pseudomonadota bacterium]